jgi:hypothetical protein
MGGNRGASILSDARTHPGRCVTRSSYQTDTALNRSHEYTSRPHIADGTSNCRVKRRSDTGCHRAR